MNHLRTVTFFAALCLAAGQATQAHEVWIEDTPTGELVVRFAEYGEDFETSPGHLDSLLQPTAFVVGAESKPKALDVTKARDHFLLKGVDPKVVACVETAFPVMARGNNPGRKPFFYARWHVVGTAVEKPSLNFDLVPTGKPGEVCVYFRGQPLADVEVNAYLPDDKEETFKSDANGLVTVPVTEKGFYLLHCKHQREDTPGYAAGLRYEQVSHNCSLAWRQK